MHSDMLSEGASWSQQVISLYEVGGSDAEVAASLRVTLKAFYKQMQDSGTFAELIDFGRTLSKAYWERLAREHVKDKNFNSSLYSFYMKNRHGWADKVETSSTNENLNTDLDSLRQQVTKEVESFIKRNTPELSDAQRVLAGLQVDMNVQ